jgi:hypothetical protein
VLPKYFLAIKALHKIQVKTTTSTQTADSKGNMMLADQGWTTHIIASEKLIKNKTD